MKDIRQKLLATFEIEHRDHVEQIRSLVAMLENTAAPGAGSALEEVFRRAHSLKGAARAVDLHQIEGLAHRLETLFSRVRQGGFTIDRDVTGVVQQVLDASEDCLAALSENRPASGVPAALGAIERILGGEATAPDSAPEAPPSGAPAFQPLETVKISAQNFNGLFRTAAGLVSESQRQDRLTARLHQLERDLAQIETQGERIRRAPAASRASGAEPFLESIGRQVRSVSRQASLVRRMHQRSAWTMRHFGRQLQQDIRQARMVPAESLLEGNRKMVRDLARDQGKEIEFRAAAAGVHADRRVLNALKDPVMHLLRNAVIHGIEPPEERRMKGKPSAGVVTLRIDASGQQMTVSVEDDGRGVDLARVAQLAVRDGLLSQQRATECPASELSQLLFRPGFSTAAAVTNLCGRGMGLSVVQEAVRRLQGDASIEPGARGGTVIVLSVHLSISTYRLMLVTSDGQTFAIPILGIERLSRVPVEAVQNAEGKPIVMLDGEPVALSTIPALLGGGNTAARPEGGSLQIVVVRSGSQRAAFAVDAVVRETEAAVQDLGPASRTDGRISSGVVLDDDTVALVVNPMELVQAARQLAVPVRVVEQAAANLTKEASPPSVLVVDDSMTTRTLEKSILEAQGYRVRVAVDGVDALTKLRQEKPDLVIADIEMPRLSGFGLIEAMKSDPALDRIPVIIVSSVERREDQERGLALGADAYIVKRKFDQEDLLAVIRQIL